MRDHYATIQRTKRGQLLIGIPKHLHHVFDGADEVKITELVRGIILNHAV